MSWLSLLLLLLSLLCLLSCSLVICLVVVNVVATAVVFVHDCFAVGCLLCVVLCCVLFVVCLLFGVRCSLFVVRCLLFVCWFSRPCYEDMLRVGLFGISDVGICACGIFGCWHFWIGLFSEFVFTYTIMLLKFQNPKMLNPR